MKQKRLLLLILPLIIVLAVSCRKKAVEEGPRVTFETFEISEKHHLKNDLKNPGLSISLKLEFPTAFADEAVLKKIQKTVLTDFFPDIEKDITDPKKALNAYVKVYIQFFEDSETGLLDDSKNDEDNTQEDDWWDNEKMLLRHNADNILSYTVVSDRFAGGAHGGMSYLNTVINLKTGDAVTEDDLFTEESRTLISEIILKKIMAKYQVKKAVDLEQIGFFDIMEIGLNKNFYLTDKGITYTYNEYEIAAYTVGTIEVFLDFKDISGLLIPGNPIEQIIP